MLYHVSIDNSGANVRSFGRCGWGYPSPDDSQVPTGSPNCRGRLQGSSKSPGREHRVVSSTLVLETRSVSARADPIVTRLFMLPRCRLPTLVPLECARFRSFPLSGSVLLIFIGAGFPSQAEGREHCDPAFFGKNVALVVSGWFDQLKAPNPLIRQVIFTCSIDWGSRGREFKSRRPDQIFR